jgi:meso-butanediol dehydrogenase / (S,S)-butanediol dehydrogenase / diacetyl reductase
MEARLTGKVAIVTGSGQGIGRGIAMRLAREGAAVVVAEFNPETGAETARLIGEQAGQAASIQVNIGDVASVQRLVLETVVQFGHIDILVNNAGVVQTKPMLDLTEADWDRVVQVNQRGTFFCLQAVAQQMIGQLPPELQAARAPADIMNIRKTEQSAAPTNLANSYGKIVNLSSVAGRRGRSLQTHYAATKAAIISITQSAAMALAPYRINVNAICPGIVPTPMWQEIDRDRGQLFGAQPGEAMAAFIDTVPLKRPATPEDIGGAVAFFCSADADYITGQALNVDGGFEMD